MKELIYNSENLNDNDIEETVIRTKGLLINDNNEIILGLADDTYQFPGGHKEENESIESCLKREIREETGIEITKNNLKPFMLIKRYMTNYRNTNKSRLNLIYYYLIKTNEKPNPDNTNYDDYEKQFNYKTVLINLNEVKEVLIASVEKNAINKFIVEEMLEVLEECQRASNI